MARKKKSRRGLGWYGPAVARRGRGFQRKGSGRKKQSAPLDSGRGQGDTVRLTCDRRLRDGTILRKGTPGKIVAVAQHTYRIKFRGHAAVRRISKRFIAVA